MSKEKVVSTVKIEILTLEDGYKQLHIGDSYATLSVEECLYAMSVFLIKKEIHPWLKTKEFWENCPNIFIEKDLRCQS